MTASGFAVLFAGVFLLLTAFSLGSAVLLGTAVLLFLALGYSMLSVHLARRRFSLRLTSAPSTVRRGESVNIRLEARCACPLPAGHISCSLSMEDAGSQHLVLSSAGRGQKAQFSLPCMHVGSHGVQVTDLKFHDLFGLYALPSRESNHRTDALVLPNLFEVSTVPFARDEGRLGTMSMATEDITSPSDVRSYQTGDPLKKVHWKLSGRRQELIVRKYEEPVLPEALMILDTSLPDAGEARADLMDALLETAASCISAARQNEYTLLLPLSGPDGMQLSSQMDMPLVLECLARVRFSAEDDFAQVLSMESRRLRRTGATIIVTTRLTGETVDRMIHLRRMGPTLRVYLITTDPDEEAVQPFILQLQEGLCDVCYVTPSRESVQSSQ